MGSFLCTCYLAIMAKMKLEHPEALFENITRRAKSVLSPSWKLLNRCNSMKKRGVPEDEIWAYYEWEFIREMEDNFDAVHAKLEELREIAKERDVYLVCVEANRNVEENEHCHRFLVRKMLTREIVLKRV